MKKYALLTTAFILSACVSSPDYGETLQAWVGSSSEALQTSWGNPATVNYIAPHQELWTYFQNSPSGAEFCRTTFTITNGIINDFAFEGYNCALNLD